MNILKKNQIAIKQLSDIKGVYIRSNAKVYTEEL
ncbi:hypothetical protein FHS70_000729 [Flammeovirga yaeyamensis]|nr:hypothetical protein [Flammeovirga yaeyamensis]